MRGNQGSLKQGCITHNRIITGSVKFVSCLVSRVCVSSVDMVQWGCGACSLTKGIL